MRFVPFKSFWRLNVKYNIKISVDSIEKNRTRTPEELESSNPDRVTAEHSKIAANRIKLSKQGADIGKGAEALPLFGMHYVLKMIIISNKIVIISPMVIEAPATKSQLNSSQLS